MKIELYSKKIEETFNLRLNKNQAQQIQRLIYEIIRTNNLSIKEIIGTIREALKGKKPCGKDLFWHIKRRLIELRFPLSSSKIKIDSRNVFLNKLELSKNTAFHPQKEFIPKKIVLEKEVRDCYLAKRIKEKYPQVNIKLTDYYSLFLKNYKLTPFNLKEPILFIVKERWDFIKKCPCTKNQLGCGYWILNLGFGCPFDCSYCYLQQYQNFPGIILPSNLDDFFKKFDSFFRKIKRPIRIGTGEFCDSLALDEITLYSEKLIDFFSKREVLFELKTKSNKIENILRRKPSKNIIISWSLNPQKIIDSEEYGVATLKERLEAAQKIQKKGFNLAFHFDPIIYSKHWKKDYKSLIGNIYNLIKPPFAWISLGTLRFNRELKYFIEQRFPESKIVYGELFIGEDKKLRYPEFLRIEIYKDMVKWIREFDKKTPIYLCMESKKIWKESLLEVNSSKDVENYLIKNNA